MRLIQLTKENNYGYSLFFKKGLVEHSDFFRISTKDEMNEAFPTLGLEDSFTLAVIDEINNLMGVASFKLESNNREKLLHKGLLFRMYVDSEHSGLGIGKLLIQEIIDRAKLLKNIEQINLTVVSTNIIAKSLYTKFGFQTYGIEHKSIKYKGKYLDEDLMVLYL